MLKVMIFGAIISFLAACAGREDDYVQQQETGVQSGSEDLTAFGWQTDQPSLVVFAAGWCKPCIKEIPYIEKLNQKYDGQLEVFGYLVEGQVGGQAPTNDDIENFDNQGVRNYPVYKDVDWELMSAVNSGPRILPAIYLFDKDRNMIDNKEGSITEENLEKWVLSKLNLKGDSEDKDTEGAEGAEGEGGDNEVAGTDSYETRVPTTTSTSSVPQPILAGPPPEDGNVFSAAEFFEYYDDETVMRIRDLWDEAVENGTGIAADSEEAKDYQIDDAEIVIDRDNPDEEVTITHIKLDKEFNSKCYTIMYLTLDGEYIGDKGYCLPIKKEEK